MTDITTLKQAQAALRASETSLERAQKIAQIGSWEIDVATGEVVWSKQVYRMCGLPIDYKPARGDMASRLHADDVQAISEWCADLQAGRQRDPIEIRLKHTRGKECVNLLEGRPVVDPDGVIRHVVGTVQDITERRLLERTLTQSQKMDAIGQLTGGMAHDFNNILGIVIGNLDLLKPLLGADALKSELCEEAREGAVRCADLIRQLLAFARRQSLRPDRLDVNVLVSDVSRLLRRTLGEQIALAVDLAATLWPVKVDAAQLETALINLATNARDAMPKGGQLTIATGNTTLDALYAAQHPDVSAGDYALIEISDTGTGISPENIGRIFDPFFTTKVSGLGTGLGLSMAFGFVKQSGGLLLVYSELGLGTTFRLYLPRSDSGETATASTPNADVVVGGDETILVVEDNAQLRRTAERQLSGLGYTVREADSALPALAILSSGDAVDFLFTDIVMPGTMDGLDLAYQATRLRPDLRVLLTSGFPGGRSADQRMADSPFRLLGKPYSLGDLAQAVRMVLDNASNGGTSRPPAL
jgi:PAS domain S-box-containing protein